MFTRWDRTDQIVQQIHTDATPGEKYSQYLWGYDAAGQVTKVVEPQKEECFFRDAAGNRTEEHRNPVWHNLLLRLDGLKLDYEGFGGRLTRRQDKNGVVQHFAYDDEQCIKEIRFEWYHTELNGLPERVTDANGQTVWRGQFSTWGKTERELSVPQWQVPQNLRFQGLYLDHDKFVGNKFEYA